MPGSAWVVLLITKSTKQEHRIQQPKLEASQFQTTFDANSRLETSGKFVSQDQRKRRKFDIPKEIPIDASDRPHLTDLRSETNNLDP
jgi:hypothetical protein